MEGYTQISAIIINTILGICIYHFCKNTIDRIILACLTIAALSTMFVLGMFY